MCSYLNIILQMSAKLCVDMSALFCVTKVLRSYVSITLCHQTYVYLCQHYSVTPKLYRHYSLLPKLCVVISTLLCVTKVMKVMCKYVIIILCHQSYTFVVMSALSCANVCLHRSESACFHGTLYCFGLVSRDIHL